MFVCKLSSACLFRPTSVSLRYISTSRHSSYRYYRELPEFKEFRSIFNIGKKSIDYPSKDLPLSRQELDDMSVDIWRSLGDGANVVERKKLNKQSNKRWFENESFVRHVLLNLVMFLLLITVVVVPKWSKDRK